MNVDLFLFVNILIVIFISYQSHLALGEQQLDAAAGGGMGDGAILVLIVVADIVE